MRVAIDFDDVIAQTCQALVVENLGPDESIERVKSWEWWKWIAPEMGLDLYSTMDRPGFFLGLEPVPGACDGIGMMQVCGIDVIVVSSCRQAPKHSYHEKQEWLRKFVPELDPKNFIACSRKDTIACDVLLDDAPHNLKTARGISVCFDRPWNRDIDVWGCDARVTDWTEFLALIGECSTDQFLSNSFSRRSRLARSAWERRRRNLL